jgi:hypothetical protein
MVGEGGDDGSPVSSHGSEGLAPLGVAGSVGVDGGVVPGSSHGSEGLAPVGVAGGVGVVAGVVEGVNEGGDDGEDGGVVVPGSPPDTKSLLPEGVPVGGGTDPGVDGVPDGVGRELVGGAPPEVAPSNCEASAQKATNKSTLVI